MEVFERTDTGTPYIVDAMDSEEVREEQQRKGQDFQRYSDVNSFIVGFNMIDPVIGMGDSAERKIRNRKLRQAISIAIDWDEYSKIFPKKGGQTAMSPLPQGIPGSREGTQEGINPNTHREVNGKARLRPVEEAKELLAQAGYPNGRDARTGQPLVLNYDYYAPATPERKPEIDWMVRQFAKLGVQLEVRATDNNQFQDKVRKGKHQVFWLGWNADYPDAENFLFLLYGPNSKSVSDGENTSNYQNPEYDQLFAQLKTMDDGPQKQAVIDKMVHILQEDAPWSFGFYPWASVAAQRWVKNSKPAILIRDHGRYLRLDATERTARLKEWNQPLWWPFVLLLAAIAGGIWAAKRLYRRRERMNGRGQVLA